MHFVLNRKKEELFKSMKRYLLILTVFLTGCTVFSTLQKSRYIAVSNLIETSRYIEAKQMVEDMVADEQFSRWPRTWYLRGVLCQKAYREGRAANDRNRYELYPDQLYVAFESFEKAISLDSRGRKENQLKPRYVLLANDFQQMGERHFRASKYKEALRAFEHALEITRRPVLAMKADTNLVYNAALAAFESENWKKANHYLGKLHNAAHSTNVTHLLFLSTLATGDSYKAKTVLREGIDKYEDNKQLVLLLVDMHLQEHDFSNALDVLERAISGEPSNPAYHYTSGLVYQRMGKFNDAILAYFEAIEHDPDEIMAYVNIATCYYNMGVEIAEQTRTLSSSNAVAEKRKESEAAITSAVSWLDKAYEKEPDDQAVLIKIYELYRMLRITDRVRSIENQIY